MRSVFRYFVVLKEFYYGWELRGFGLILVYIFYNYFIIIFADFERDAQPFAGVTLQTNPYLGIP